MIIKIDDYKIIYNSTCDAWDWDTINKGFKMWTKEKLYEQMDVFCWDTGEGEGVFIHAFTGARVDLSETWMIYAWANETPAPF